MKKLKLLIMTCVLLCGFGTAGWAQVWEDYSAKINDASFEEGTPVEELTKGTPWKTSSSWTLSPSSRPENSQAGIGNSSSKIQGIASSFLPSEGDNYMYIRCNWQADTEFKLTQTISNTSTLPAGVYKLTCKVATFSSSSAATQFRLSLSDGTNIATACQSAPSSTWSDWSVIIRKTEATSDLTIEAYMKPGAAAGGQHYCLLLDAFKLEYLSDEAITAIDSSIDFSPAVSNANIFNVSKGSIPYGWTEGLRIAGNNNRTEGTGDTQLEGWSDGTLTVHYYQQLNSPNGLYEVTSYTHDTNGKGGYLYATSGGTTGKATMPKDYADIKTKVFVADNQLVFGIKADAIGGTWMTGDKFRLTYYSPSSAFKQAYEAAQAAASSAEYSHVLGKEKKDLNDLISTYATAPTEVTELKIAYNSLVSATDAFIAAKDAYDALAIEKGKAAQFGLETYTVTDATTAAIAIDETHKMMVAECNKVADDYTLSVKLGKWTTTGPVGSLSGQHWDGTGSSFYYEQSGTAYGQSSWDITYTQDVKLPAGKYVFKMTGRHGSNSGVLNNTMELIVKNGETQIGTVNDFPVGDTGLGVNKNGMTSFDAKDAAGFANDNKGRGWQWRYVPFTLDAETTVTFTIHAAATGVNQWVSFCNYTVEALPNVAIWKVVHQQAKEEAETAKSTYTNVKGKELNDLTTALAITPEESIESLTAAINQLKSATSAFISANDDWSRYLIASQTATAAGISYTDISTDTEKTGSDALTAANGLLKQSADAVKTVDLSGKTIGFEAGEWTLYLIQPSLSYIATLLGEDGNAADEKIVAADAIAIKNAVVAIKGWTANEAEVNAVVSPISAEAWTGASEGWRYTTLNTASTGTTGTSAFANSGTITYGTASGYSMPLKANTVYVLKFKHASWDDGNKDNGGTVSVLNAGGEGLVASDYAGNGTNKTGWFNTETYLFRTGAAGNYTLTLVADGGRSTLTDISILKATASDLTIDEAAGYTPAAAYANVSLKRTFVTGWNGLVLPFDMTAEEAKTTFNATAVKDFDEVTDDGSNATLKFVDAENIKAGVPVLIKVTAPAKGNTYALNNVWLPGTALQNVNKKSTNADFTFTGTYSATTDLQAVSFVLIQGDKLYSHEANSSATTAKSMRAYFANNTTEGAKSLNILFDLDGETTAITEVKNNSQTTQTYYDMLGRRILKPVKGLYIQNGKKVVIK